MSSEYPWEVSPLDGWSIVGMNHYHIAGEIQLFCAMTKDGRCIQAEGDCAEVVFNSLKSHALEYKDN